MIPIPTLHFFGDVVFLEDETQKNCIGFVGLVIILTQNVTFRD